MKREHVRFFINRGNITFVLSVFVCYFMVLSFVESSREKWDWTLIGLLIMVLGAMLIHARYSRQKDYHHKF